MSTTEEPPEVTVPTITTKVKATPTEYVVLALKGTSWAVVDAVTTTGSTAAIKKYLDEKGKNAQPPDALVAVPARSWQPVKPKTETVTKTTLVSL